ncbi:MAG: ATP-binding cassette domain-containing protein [Rhizobiales bacterium]|nr:ATP-binding cassette domain-containing protein [Hyphomicrobiales bacterium]
MAFICMGIVAATTGASAWIMKDIINRIFVQKEESMVWIIAGAVMIIFLTKGLATYFQQVLLTRIGNSIIASLQRRIFDRILSQSLDFYQRHPMSDLATRMSHNAGAARAVIDLIITSIGRDVLSVIALTSVMVIQDPLMSVLVLVVMPVAVLFVTNLVKRVKKIARAELQFLTRITSTMNETATGVRIVKSFNMEERMRAIMNSAIADVQKRNNKMATIGAMTSPIMETLGGFAVALVICYGGWNVIQNGADPGGFFSFLTALLMAYEPAKRLARLNVQFHGGMVGVGQLYDVLDEPVSISEADDARVLEVKEGRVSLKDVTFAYSDVPALNSLSLDAAPSSVTALVGPSGAGKSTIFGLIERFYDPQQGTISIDGQDLKGVTFESLRRQVALVTQETFLFEGTIRENIAYGLPDASFDMIVEAAKNANADEFIQEMPDGYDSMVGAAGSLLSGGQRQRISIARAMLRDAPILLMDEPTSALDAQSEAKVQEALDRLMKGRTTIVIAHRLSTVRNADVIHVMDRGRVLQSGSHDELLRQGGLYAQLYELQFKDVPVKMAATAD